MNYTIRITLGEFIDILFNGGDIFISETDWIFITKLLSSNKSGTKNSGLSG